MKWPASIKMWLEFPDGIMRFVRQHKWWWWSVIPLGVLFFVLLTPVIVVMDIVRWFKR